MGKVNFRQFVWGVVIGAITVGIAGVAYKVGYDRGEESAREVLGEETESEKELEVNPDAVSIYIRENCETVEENKEQEGKEVRGYCVVPNEGESAFDVMTRLAEEPEFSFDYVEYDFGNMITEINGGSVDDTEFWSFYVNGEMSMSGVSGYLVQVGDELGFVIEEIEM
jgi:hypothetical protein